MVGWPWEEALQILQGPGDRASLRGARVSGHQRTRGTQDVALQLCPTFFQDLPITFQSSVICYFSGEKDGNFL